MQSLMGDRLLKLFLKSTRRRMRRSGSEQVESKPEREGALTGLPERILDHSTKGVLQSQSEPDPQCSRGQTPAADETCTDNKDLVDDTTTSRDGSEGYES